MSERQSAQNTDDISLAMSGDVRAMKRLRSTYQHGPIKQYVDAAGEWNAAVGSGMQAWINFRYNTEDPSPYQIAYDAMEKGAHHPLLDYIIGYFAEHSGDPQKNLVVISSYRSAIQNYPYEDSIKITMRDEYAGFLYPIRHTAQHNLYVNEIIQLCEDNLNAKVTILPHFFSRELIEKTFRFDASILFHLNREGLYSDDRMARHIHILEESPDEEDRKCAQEFRQKTTGVQRIKPPKKKKKGWIVLLVILLILAAGAAFVYFVHPEWMEAIPQWIESIKGETQNL